MFRRLIIVLTVVAISIDAWASESNGADIVSAELPELIDAMSRELDHDGIESFFELWKVVDVENFKSCIQFLRSNDAVLKATAGSNRNIVGCLFETYATAKARHLADSNHLKFMNSVEYDTLNLYGQRPDGIIFSELNSDRAVLFHVVESKTGRSSFYESQALGIFKQWKKDGIVVSLNGQPRRIRPRHVFLFDENGHHKPILKVNFEEFAKRYLLYSHKPPSKYKMRHEAFDLDLGTAIRITNSFMERIYGRQEKHVAHTPKRVINAELVKKFSRFFIEYHRWPSCLSDNLVECALAKEIQRVGGQQTFYAYHLDQEFKSLMTFYEIYPHRIALELIIERLGPKHPETSFLLHTYFKANLSEQELLAWHQDPLSSPSFVNRLTKNSLPWRYFFANFRVSQASSYFLKIPNCISIFQQQTPQDS